MQALQEENEKLREEIYGDKFLGINKGLKQERLDLIKQYKSVMKEKSKLYKENEELKKENKKLKEEVKTRKSLCNHFEMMNKKNYEDKMVATQSLKDEITSNKLRLTLCMKASNKQIDKLKEEIEQLKIKTN